MAPRLTRREAALTALSNAPLDMAVDVPEQRAKRTYPESDLQCACVKHYNERARIDRTFRDRTRLFAVAPHDGKKTPWQRDFQKRMGMVPGVFDLHFMDQRTSFQYTWIECKSLVGHLTTEQKEWWSWLDGTPILRCTVRTLDQFLVVIR